MDERKLYGLSHEQEECKEEILRTVRGPFARFFDGLLGRGGFCGAGIVHILLLFWHPFLWPFLALSFFAIFLCRLFRYRHAHLPMRMPGSYGGIDYNAPKPGGGYRKSAGLIYLGNERESSEELWISGDDALTHMLVLGTTGSGKTEMLVSLCYNYFALGSGVIYVDPKAAPKLGVQLWTMARLLGRDDDFLLINYMAEKRKGLRQSNTQNPFATGDANSLTQLLFALMPDDPAGGSIFSSTAQTLISGLLFVLVERRNMGLEELSIETIRTYLMDVRAIDALARESVYTETAHLALVSALSTVGWDEHKPYEKQSRNFSEQYAYARAYFGRALSLLVDNYGRIFRASHGEVDAVDIIVNRRIFVTLIPSIDKDPRELKSLGQICLASVRNACSVGLGTQVQGRLSDVLGALPTASRVPFGIIVDEYAAIETPGFEILLTQGRGLGMAVTVASQDYAGIHRASSAAAEQIVSNCKVKLFMATEDPKQTSDLVRSLAGKSFVMASSGYTRKDGSAYFDSGNVRAEQLERVDFRDLQRQIEGDATISFRGEIIRARTFYANPPLSPDQSVRLNYLLQCFQPDAEMLDGLYGDMFVLVRAFEARYGETGRATPATDMADEGETDDGDWGEMSSFISDQDEDGGADRGDGDREEGRETSDRDAGRDVTEAHVPDDEQLLTGLGEWMRLERGNRTASIVGIAALTFAYPQDDGECDDEMGAS